MFGRLVICLQIWAHSQNRPDQTDQNWNVTKAEMSPQLKFNQKINVTKPEMSPKMKCNQKRIVTRTKSHQNWNVSKTYMSPKLKGKQATAELGANTDANHTCGNLFRIFFWQIFFFLMLTKEYVFLFKGISYFYINSKRKTT